MSVKEESLEDEKEVKKKLKKGFIDKIILFIEKKIDNIPSLNEYFESITIVQGFADLGDNKSESLFQYHNKVVKDYLKECFELMILQQKDILIDLFIKQTENINIFLYWMNRLFTYLDRYHTITKNKGTLSYNEMNLYKEICFNPLKDDIYKELNKLIKQDRNGNKESRNKIKSIIKILNDIDIDKPKITMENQEIKWIFDPPHYESHFTYNYQNEWYEKYFKEETIQFAKEKAEKERQKNILMKNIMII